MYLLFPSNKFQCHIFHKLTHLYILENLTRPNKNNEHRMLIIYTIMTTYNLKLNSIMENEKNKKPCHLDKTVKNSPCTHSRNCIPKRYLSSRLSLGDPTAHRKDRKSTRLNSSHV